MIGVAFEQCRFEQWLLQQHPAATLQRNERSRQIAAIDSGNETREIRLKRARAVPVVQVAAFLG